MEYNNKRPLVYSLIVVLLLITGITVAWLTWRSESTNIGISTGCFTINYSKGQDISGASLKLLNENNIISNNNITITEGMAVTTASIGINSSCNIEGTGTLKLNVNSLSSSFTTGDSVGSLKYAVVSYNPSTYPNVTVANLASTSFGILSTGTITSTGTIDIHTEQLSNTVVNNYIIIIYIDGSRAGNDIIGSTFSGTVSAEANQGEIPVITAATMITNLYNPDDNITPTVNNVTYNLDTTNRLMADTAGNIRYYGATPNNYIDIGDVYEEDFLIKNWELNYYESEELCYHSNECYLSWEEDGYASEEECYSDRYGVSSADELCATITFPEGTPILYRIIGVFKDVKLSDGTTKDLVKVMRDESIGDYSWDVSVSTVNSGRGINEWSQADLMKLLNPGFESNEDLEDVFDNGSTIIVNNSLYWTGALGTCYTLEGSRTCDFRGIGLSENVHDKIAEVVWNLGGHDDSSVYASAMYGYERGENVIQNPSDGITRTKLWPGKVALMYPSDYGYAADLSQCQQELFKYYEPACSSNNWMVNSDGQWLLTPYTGGEDLVWYFDVAALYDSASYSHGSRPTFYLNSDVSIVGGTGVSNDPYQIG